MKENKESSAFRIIEGNLLIDPQDAGGDFVLAEATNTRLMGVVGLHIERNQEGASFHQFFYIDTEEYGLDDYQSLLDADSAVVEDKKNDLFGALGGQWIKITEKEALFLVRNYAQINIRKNLLLPDDLEEYAPILETDFKFTANEKSALWEKICVKLHNDYELINYFVMRMVARDNEFVTYLSMPGGSIVPINTHSPGALLKNEIIKGDKYNPSDEKRIYTCVSLMDVDKSYRLTESEVTVLGDKIISLRPKSSMEISPWEASLILNQPEYIIHGILDGYNPDEDTFKKMIFSLFSTVTESAYDFGSLYMVFKKNNDHVKKKVYRLDQDTLGVVCVMYDGEIVFASNDPLHVEAIESTILAAASLNNVTMRHIGNYKFPEPMLVRFIDSNFERFEDFLKYLHSLRNE